ncbi:nuclease-related domain-containing protein [Streptomyces marincola]|uniref:NERD nuclease n=1 Tax=Streptomyces marincola TaxID=2878388 RepID=A0A1W7CZ12_9ACTN|nr:nuclease-related domain-containing protein [Streptomyces marincola]ARQ69899.1 NERD nuclease [Streptomyces marincola]
MSKSHDLTVSPWKRFGHDRLYVNSPAGEKIAWLDRTTGRITVLVEEQRDAALDALAPHLAEASPGSTATAPPAPADPVAQVRPPAVGLRPGDDLAANRPGEALLAKLAELRPSFWRYLLTKLLGRASEADSWRKGLRGEQKAGAELERLTGRGWRVLHSIPLPRDVDIDHLLIGPGGVFSINTKHHSGAHIWVGDDSVKIADRSYPYVRKSRAEARRASAALTRACGFPVEVSPVLAFVDARKVVVVPSLHDVRVVGHREIATMKTLTGVWSAASVENIYMMARDRRTWSRARGGSDG